MTTAVHNITGEARLSTFDGGGGIFADRADDIARRVGSNWGAQSDNCSAPSSSDVSTISLTAGQRTRTAIANSFTEFTVIKQETEQLYEQHTEQSSPDGADIIEI